MNSNLHRSLFSFFKRPTVIGMSVIIVVFAGLWFDVSNAGGESDNFYADIIRFDNVATKVRQNYVEDMKFDELIDNGINGMLHILDPHTNYFKPQQYEELKIHTEGKFGGLGIQIAIRDKVLTVMTPIAGTPASRAGIQSGDQIITIDGKPTGGITIDKAVSKLRGEPGTKVTITIRRKGEAKDMEYTITREIIRIKPVPYYGLIDSSIGYIYLSTFSQDAGTEVERAIKALLKKNIKGLVFDLRQDPGGLLPEAKDVAEKFLPKRSLIVSTRGRTMDQNREFYSENEPALPNEMPLAVLVNYASASASEIVAGAIQDWDRGIILGDTTFGKGSVQSVFPLDKTHHLKMTTAYYYTPSGRCINRPENAVRGAAVDSEDSEMNGDTTSSDSTVKPEKAKKDTLQYQTKNGRFVYGSGGIIPDSVLPQEIPNVVIRALFGKDAFFQFANLEYARLKKKNKIGEATITVDEEIVKDFYRYLDSIKFVYQSLSQIKFDEFKRKSELVKDTAADSAAARRIFLPGEKPQWTDREKAELNKAANLIDSVLAYESRRAVAESDIKKFLYEALLIRHFGQDDEVYYRWKLGNDPQVKTAIRFLTNKSLYSGLLKPPAGAGKQQPRSGGAAK